MKTRMLVTLLALNAPAAAQTTNNAMTTTTDTRAVLELLRGNVDMYGVNFGNTEFQRGILQLAQSGTIKIRVLTAPNAAQNMKPLKAVGAGIYTVKANFLNSMIVVQGGPVIIPTKTNFQIITDPKNAAAMSGLLTQYWQIAKAY